MVNGRAKLRYKWKKKLGFDRNVMVIRKRPLAYARRQVVSGISKEAPPRMRSAAGRRRHKNCKLRFQWSPPQKRAALRAGRLLNTG